MKLHLHRTHKSRFEPINPYSKSVKFSTKVKKIHDNHNTIWHNNTSQCGVGMFVMEPFNIEGKKALFLPSS